MSNSEGSGEAKDRTNEVIGAVKQEFDKHRGCPRVIVGDLNAEPSTISEIKDLIQDLDLVQDVTWSRTIKFDPIVHMPRNEAILKPDEAIYYATQSFCNLVLTQKSLWNGQRADKYLTNPVRCAQQHPIHHVPAARHL